jgi:ATP-dependent 26S proteasome regulatory subunit
LELESFKEKIKENQEKIKLNKQLPYLVGNIVEVKNNKNAILVYQIGSSIVLRYFLV